MALRRDRRPHSGPASLEPNPFTHPRRRSVREPVMPLSGEQHPRAKLTDREVEIIRRLHELCGISYRALAIGAQAPVPTIAAICQYRRRSVDPAAP